MRILIAGASGVIGRQLMTLLTELDHHVIAMTHRRPLTAAARVETVAVDALDSAAFGAAVRDAKPDVAIHLLTAIPAKVEPRKMTQQFLVTNRLRTEATRTLIDAARSVGCGRIITQSVAFAYDLDGAKPGEAQPAHEGAPLFRDVAPQWRSSLEAITELERSTLAADGLALRFGHLYGPGTAFDTDGDTVDQVRNHKLPVVGKGTSIFSFVHTRDAATAIAAAVSRPVTGVLNVVDDDPAPTREWVPELADILGVKRPGSAPAFAVRIVGGAWGATFLTRLRGADNRAAREALAWAPTHPSWREGLRAELGAAAPAN